MVSRGELFAECRSLIAKRDEDTLKPHLGRLGSRRLYRNIRKRGNMHVLANSICGKNTVVAGDESALLGVVAKRYYKLVYMFGVLCHSEKLPQEKYFYMIYYITKPHGCKEANA